MKQRMDIQEVAPKAYELLIGLENYLHNAGLKKSILNSSRSGRPKLTDVPFA